MDAERRIIGIVGGSCSGKTTLVHGLEELGLPDVTYISFDDYFVGTKRLAGKTVTNWEDPALYRMDEYIEHLRLLREGYSFTLECNSRESCAKGIRERLVNPSRIVIIEGFLLFHDPRALVYFDRKLFLYISPKEMLRRRFLRADANSPWDQPDYINGFLIPGYQELVLPQQGLADIVLEGTLPSNKLVDKVRQIITD